MVRDSGGTYELYFAGDLLAARAAGVRTVRELTGGEPVLPLWETFAQSFQIDLAIKALFDAPTVAELSSYIRGQILAEIEALSDEEARQLIANRSLAGST